MALAANSGKRLKPSGVFAGDYLKATGAGDDADLGDLQVTITF